MIFSSMTRAISASVGTAFESSVRIEYSRPAMKRAEGMARPSASTLARQSRAGSRSAIEPPTAKKIIQVPVEITENGARRRRMCGSRLAFESWIPATTRQSGGRPVFAASSGLMVPAVSHGRTSGANSFDQPWSSARREKVPASGFQRSVWQPSVVGSLTATPVSRQTQNCG